MRRSPLSYFKIWCCLKCPRKHACMDGWTTETASLATLTRPLTLVSGLKKCLFLCKQLASSVGLDDVHISPSVWVPKKA